jgi:hypothetical protein
MECLKEFVSFKSLAVHIRIHNLKAKEYYDKYLRKEHEGFCKLCNKTTKFYYISNGYNTYCSFRCQNIGTTEKRETTMQKKYGCKNPSQSSVIREKVKKLV